MYTSLTTLSAVWRVQPSSSSAPLHIIVQQDGNRQRTEQRLCPRRNTCISFFGMKDYRSDDTVQDLVSWKTLILFTTKCGGTKMRRNYVLCDRRVFLVSSSQGPGAIITSCTDISIAFIVLFTLIWYIELESKRCASLPCHEAALSCLARHGSTTFKQTQANWNAVLERVICRSWDGENYCSTSTLANLISVDEGL